MQRPFEIDVVTATTAAGRHETTCSCSCGWRLTTAAATTQMATRVGERAQANHFADTHPDQHDHVSRVAQAPAHGHVATLGGAIREGFAWRRSIVCACDWESAVSGRTPQESEDQARARHRRHVTDESSGNPGRDHFVLLGAVAIAATVLIVLAWVVYRATTG